MKTKNAVLKILESSKGVHISGSKLAAKTGVSRTAVWKAVNELRNDGYVIESITNRGYRLADDNDIISPESIEPYLKEKSVYEKITVLNTVDSTNDYLKRSAQTAQDCSFVIAKSQSGGRGRRGNTFYSPPDGGVYISMFIKPKELKACDAPLVTTAAAAAVCLAAEKTFGLNLQIKWINDIFKDKKKVCGILTEASTNFENGIVEYIIVGIGINVYPPKESYPEQLKPIIGTLCDKPTARSRLCGELINGLIDKLYNLENRSFIDEYKKRLFVLGQNIIVKSASGDYEAVARDITQNCELIVTDKNNRTRILNSEEISIKAE